MGYASTNRMKPTNERKTSQRLQKLRREAMSNSRVDKDLVRKTTELVSYIRSVGAKGKGFNILPSSEARVKAIYPHARVI